MKGDSVESEHSIDLSNWEKEQVGDLSKYADAIVEKVSKNIKSNEKLDYLFMYWNSGGAPVIQLFGLGDDGLWKVIPLGFDMALVRLTGKIYMKLSTERVFAYSIYIEKDESKEIKIYDNLNPTLGWENLYLIAYKEYGVELPILPYHNVTLDELEEAESFKDTLLYAVYHRNEEAVIKKLDNIKADEINQVIKGLGTPLTLASKNGDKVIVKSLLDKGADINIQDSMGYTALLHSVESGHEDIAYYLIKEGADVNIAAVDKKNPFEMSILVESSVGLKKKLLDYGFDVNTKGFEEIDLMSLAVLTGDFEALELLTKSDIDKKYINKAYEIAEAEEEGFNKMVKYLSDFKE